MVGAEARPPSLAPAGLRRVLATLCVTEITSWGVLYYAFAVLATDISDATGWSLSAVTAGFSAGQFTAAIVGIPVGRWLDRHGPHALMTAGSALAVPAVVAVATAQSVAWFIAGWVLAGVAMGAVLYPPAFAALTRWYGSRRVGALTMLTLVAGLASTVFAPLTAALAAHLDWRQTYLALGLILALVTIPGHFWGLRGAWPDPEPGGHATVGHTPDRIVRSRAFFVLVGALALTAFATYAVLVSTVPLLRERGIGAGTAALALGLGGAGQVLGRLGYTRLTLRTSVRARTALIALAVAATTGLLALLTSVVALIAAAVVAGMARGVFTLLEATAVTDRWGAVHYGQLTGVLSAPLTVTVSVAPWAGAAMAGVLGGYSATFLVLAAIAMLGAALSLASSPPLSMVTGRKTCTTPS